MGEIKNHHKTLMALRQALIDVNRIDTRRIIQDCLAVMSPVTLGDEVIAPIMTAIGDDWEHGEVSLAQIYMAGLVAEEVISQLISADSRARRQPIIAITVLGDQHLLGKSIVNSVVQASGWITRDLGSQDTDELLQYVERESVDILMISTLMLRSALLVEQVCNTIGQRGLPTRVVVGGAPFRMNPELWQQVGAEAMGHNAASAIGILKRMTGESS
jgi:methanogenic corrinoid protein MtbC1